MSALQRSPVRPRIRRKAKERRRMIPASPAGALVANKITAMKIQGRVGGRRSEVGLHLPLATCHLIPFAPLASLRELFIRIGEPSLVAPVP